MRILVVYYSCIFNFNVFNFMFLFFRRALYKVADVNFYVNKGLLLLLLLQVHLEQHIFCSTVYCTLKSPTVA